MAAKLLHKMNPYQYKEYCVSINERESVSVSFYKASKWVNYFTLDTALTFRNGRVNSDHVYDYFGVRKNLLTYVSGNMDFVIKQSSVCLPMRGLDLDTWIDNINDGKPCDELALLILSAMYHCHSLVVTKSKSWCTIASPTPLSLLQCMSACTVRLLYLGDLSFGVLKWKPQVPKAVSDKPKLGEFKIVEEYTLDEQQSTFKKLAIVKPTPVETPKDAEQPGTSATDLPVQQSQVVPSVFSPKCDSPPKPTVVYAAENTDFFVETTPTIQTDIASAANYPWKKKLCVSVRRLSDFEISYWCGPKHDGLELPIKVETTPVQVINLVKQEEELTQHVPNIRSSREHSHVEDGSSTEQSTEKLLAHAKSLIKHVSVALSTTEELKTKSKGSTLPSRDSDSVKTHTQQRVFRVETNKQQQSVVKQITCQMCNYVCTSVAALADHHTNDHGILKCSFCDKAFSSKPSLDKHMHVHTNPMAFVCEECGQGFPFKSRMLQHKITHSVEAHFLCKHGTCGKSFKNTGDVTHQQKSHDNMWYYCSHCPYKNKDKRNQDSHSRVHEPAGLECYHCDKCGKSMCFSTQMRRHRKTGCEVNTFHV